MDAHARNRLYLVLTTLQPLLMFYGLADESQAPLWISLGAAVLGNGLAVLNADTARIWLYGVAGAVATLVVAYGLISGAEAEMWLTVLAAVLGIVGTGTAAVTTPPTRAI
jgi:hypothetical protein